MSAGTKEDPFTHGSANVSARHFRWCKCRVCGRIAKCTPEFDFYTPVVAGVHVLDGPLQCQTCMLAGKVMIDFTHKAQA